MKKSNSVRRYSRKWYGIVSILTYASHDDYVIKRFVIYIKRFVKSLDEDCSLTQFTTPEHELDKLLAAECVFVFHEVKHD